MRCRCCNIPLKSNEIIWYAEQQRHEDLCLKCRNEIDYEEWLAGWRDLSSKLRSDNSDDISHNS